MNGIIFLLGISLLFIVFIVILNYYDDTIKKREMKDLTGKYSHDKTPDGIIIKVQYLKKNKVHFRIATDKEVNILKKYKYL